MIRRPPRSTPELSSAASDVYKRQAERGCRSPGSCPCSVAASPPGPGRPRYDLNTAKLRYYYMAKGMHHYTAEGGHHYTAKGGHHYTAKGGHHYTANAGIIIWQRKGIVRDGFGHFFFLLVSCKRLLYHGSIKKKRKKDTIDELPCHIHLPLCL